jgi:hypothetical protein
MLPERAALGFIKIARVLINLSLQHSSLAYARLRRICCIEKNMRFCRLAIALRFANWRWPATGNFRVLQLALLPKNSVDEGIRFAPGPGAGHGR